MNLCMKGRKGVKLKDVVSSKCDANVKWHSRANENEQGGPGLHEIQHILFHDIGSSEEPY